MMCGCAWGTSAWVCYMCLVCVLQLTQTPNLVIITTNELYTVTYSHFFLSDTLSFSVKISFPLFLQCWRKYPNTWICLGFHVTTYRCLIIITSELNTVISTFFIRHSLLSSQGFIYTLTYMYRLPRVTVLNLHMPNYYNQWTLYDYPYHFSFPDKSSLQHCLKQN